MDDSAEGDDTTNIMNMYSSFDDAWGSSTRGSAGHSAYSLNAAFNPGGSSVYGGMQSNGSRYAKKDWWRSNTYVSEDVKLDGITLSLPKMFPMEEREPTIRQTIMEQSINALKTASKPTMEWKANVLAQRIHKLAPDLSKNIDRILYQLNDTVGPNYSYTDSQVLTGTYTEYTADDPAQNMDVEFDMVALS